MGELIALFIPNSPWLSPTFLKDLMSTEFTLPKITDAISRLDQLFELSFTKQHSLMNDWKIAKLQVEKPCIGVFEFKELIERLDDLFYNVFSVDHPAMQDWIAVKFKLKELKKI